MLPQYAHSMACYAVMSPHEIVTCMCYMTKFVLCEMFIICDVMM